LYERSAYDAESHRLSLTGTMGTGTASYDGRGKMYSTDATVTYSPMGVLTSSNSGTVIEAYEADPLGNVYRTDVSGPDLPTTQPKYTSYSDSTAQLIQDWTRDGAFTDTTNYVFNPRTGVLISSDHLKNVDTIPGQHRYEHRTNRNFYDKQAQLDSTTFLVDTMPYSLGHLSTDYHAAEYYRYDALNRRVWMRNLRDANCIHQDRSSGCRSNERRTVWDGDQILYEIQVKGDSGSAVLDDDSYALAPYYGTVRYTHGTGTDAPLALYKGNQTVVPMQTFTGKYFNGRCRPAANCATYSAYWPEGSGSTYRMHGTQADGPPSWYGSLIESQQDASGLQYKRNRYYDPQSGRFTQEDPIGLAGGLNAYGYANGDPVSYSDPFGLCPGNSDDTKKTNKAQRDTENCTQANKNESPGQAAAEPPDPKSPGDQIQSHQTGPTAAVIFYTSINDPKDFIVGTAKEGRWAVQAIAPGSLTYRGVLVRQNGSRWGVEGTLKEASALGQYIRLGMFHANENKSIPSEFEP
jgi:RHS repeat-associated protein